MKLTNITSDDISATFKSNNSDFIACCSFDDMVHGGTPIDEEGEDMVLTGDVYLNKTPEVHIVLHITNEGVPNVLFTTLDEEVVRDDLRSIMEEYATPFDDFEVHDNHLADGFIVYPDGSQIVWVNGDLVGN